MLKCNSALRLPWSARSNSVQPFSPTSVATWVLFSYLFLSHMYPYRMGVEPYGCCGFLGCLGSWRVINKCGRILNGAEVCLADSLRLAWGFHEKGMYNFCVCGRCICKDITLMMYRWWYCKGPNATFLSLVRYLHWPFTDHANAAYSVQVIC